MKWHLCQVDGMRDIACSGSGRIAEPTNHMLSIVLIIRLTKIDVLQSTWEASSLGAENEHSDIGD